MNDFRWEFCSAAGIPHPDLLDTVLTPRQQHEAMQEFQRRPFGPHADMRMMARLMSIIVALVGEKRAEKEFLDWLTPAPQAGQITMVNAGALTGGND